MNNIKLLEITDEALEQYRTTVRGNENISYEQAQRKLTRNVILVREFAPERIKRNWLTLSKNYAYGNLHIFVKSGKVIKVINHKGRKQDSWNPPKQEYIKLCKQLGIEDNKYKVKTYKKRIYK